ncbi:hypothetical protein [Sinomonas halotolerans]|uniref:Uncharacterized protein n=1 Tax=Sinomonas halotolerans TaxID=1644133 RepID=A0ABU9WZ62_9MICC
MAFSLTVLVSAAGTAGCAQEPSAEALAKPAEAAAAAVASAEIAVVQRSEGRTTAAAAGTLATDMLRELESAAKDLHALESRTESQRRSLDAALAAVSVGTLAVAGARDALAHDDGGPALERALARLRQAAQALEAAVRGEAAQ